MKKQQTFLVELDLKQIRNYCDRLPLEKTDQDIAFALAQLCAGPGSYTPTRGVGQKEIARLAGVGVRTVKRRLPFLQRYGILTIDKSNGRSNCYQFDLGMLLDAPAATHDLYGYIKSKSSEPQAKPEPIIDDRQRLLFADPEPVETTAPAQETRSIITRMTGAVVQFTKRMFTTHPGMDADETGAMPSEPVPDRCQSSAKPVPSTSEPVPNQCQTGANSKSELPEPVPTEVFGAETGAKPVPTPSEPVPKRCQTGANSPLHVHETYMEEEELIKTSMPHDHEHGGSDSFSLRRVAKSENNSKPHPRKKISWGGREIQDDELKNPESVQELYEFVIEQGFIKPSEKSREDFFGLAHYVSRYKKAKNKAGLFSTLLDRTANDKFDTPFQFKLADEDEQWACKAIKDYDLPPLISETERT